MDISKRIAELLADAFLYYAHPLRHQEWKFQRGGEVLVVTVSREKYVPETPVEWTETVAHV